MLKPELWLTDRTILVVEDDAIVATGLTSYLEGLGATVTWATTICEAENSIDCSARLDLAIVDVNLDGTISTPVLDRLAHIKVPIILCTGYESSSLEDRFQLLPRCEKPFTRAKISTLIAAELS
jgi:CheY-like chemotaxis protein